MLENSTLFKIVCSEWKQYIMTKVLGIAIRPSPYRKSQRRLGDVKLH